MTKMNFWDDLVDDQLSWPESIAIDRARGAAAGAQAGADSAHARIDELEQLCARQRTDLAKLRTALDTLMAMLADQGGFDREIFGYRLEAAIENARERAQDRAAPTIGCDRCGDQVARASTTITAAGTLCARCAA